jgi:hypothetical protein
MWQKIRTTMMVNDKKTLTLFSIFITFLKLKSKVPDNVPLVQGTSIKTKRNFVYILYMT